MACRSLSSGLKSGVKVARQLAVSDRRGRIARPSCLASRRLWTEISAYVTAVPPPVIFASQDHSYHSFEAHELEAMGYGNRSQSPASTASALSKHAIRFKLTDELTGTPLARQPVAISFGGNTIKQVTDADGYTELVYTGTAPAQVTCTVLVIDDLFRDAAHG